MLVGNAHQMETWKRGEKRKRERERERYLCEKRVIERRKRKMHVARAPRLFMLTTSVCFCPVLASRREQACLLLSEQNSIMGKRMMMMYICVCLYMARRLLCSNRRCRHVCMACCNLIY